jgi:UMF1 family MFS transporter
VILAAYTLLGGYNDLLFNSMMPVAVGRRQAAKASGYALAAANIVGVLALVLVLWAFELPGKLDLSFVPARPLFGLDPAQYEPARIAGPIAAICLLLFSWPLFAFAHDAPRSGLSVPTAARRGFSDVLAVIRQARGAHGNLATYLLARVAYGDAMGAYIAFSGLYAAGVMGFRGYEMLVLGIISTFFCGLGAFVAQLLDRAIGPRRALIAELAALAVFILGEIGMAPNRVLYVAYDRAAHGPVWSGPMFTHAPDLVFILLAFGAAMTLVASGASGRTLLVRLTPTAQMGAMFGLAALTGSATSWLAPLMINILTYTWHRQQAGFIPLLILVGIGLACMLFVRGGGPVVEDAEAAGVAT